MKVTGRGSIQKCEDKPKKHCRKWRLFVRADGKQRTRVVHGTYTQAEEALRSFILELGGRVESDRVFGEYADSVCRLRRESGNFAPGTIANLERDVRTLKRALGGMPLSDITPAVARDALSWLRNGGGASGRVLSGTYMQDVFGTLNAIMRQAVSDGHVASNPLDGIDPPRNDTKERDWMPVRELEEFTGALCAMPLDGRVMAVLFMAQLGLRRGEACALHDSDVFDGIAHIRRAVKERDGSIAEPKSRAGVRNLPMPPLLRAKVEEWRSVRESSPMLSGAVTLCCNTRGGVLKPQHLYRWWESHKSELGADGYTLHQIRHSNLSMMARHMSPFDLQRWAGWSSIAPARIYIHQDDAALRAAVESAFR